MKIGFDVSAAIYGTGVSQYVTNLTRCLPQTDLKTFGYSLRRQDDIKKLFPAARVLPIPPTIADLLWNRWHTFNIEKLIGPVDVVHCSDWVQVPTRAAKVTTVHDLSPFIFPEEMDPKIVEVHTRRMRWVVSECDSIICVSKNTAADLQRLFSVDPKKISVIYEGMPLEHQLQPQVTKYSNYLITIGARQPRKNIATLVSAFLKYRQQYNLPERLIILGENSQKISDPRIIYTGFVTNQDLVNFLAGAEAFVYPSLYEGFGLPILESFYYQVPVATSNTSSLPEVAGNAAIYFDPQNEEQIAKAIADAIINKENLISLGQQQLANFSWEEAAKQTLDVYQKLC